MATAPASAADVHHMMCRKIAQLTKVIYQLHTLSDEHEVEVAALQMRYEGEIEKVLHESAQKVARLTKHVEYLRSDGRVAEAVASLQRHYTEEKERALRDLNVWKEQARAREWELQRESDRRVNGLAQQLETMRDSFLERTRTFDEMEKDLHMRMRAMEEGTKKAHEQELNLMEHKHKQRLSDLQAEHSVELERMRELLRVEMEKVQIQFANERQTTADAYEQQLSEQKAASQRDLAAKEAEWAEKMNRLVREGIALREERNTISKEKSEVMNSADTRRKKLTAEITKLQEKNASLEANLETLRKEVDDLQRSLGVAQEDNRTLCVHSEEKDEQLRVTEMQMEQVRLEKADLGTTLSLELETLRGELSTVKGSAHENDVLLRARICEVDDLRRELEAGGVREKMAAANYEALKKHTEAEKAQLIRDAEKAHAQQMQDLEAARLKSAKDVKETEERLLKELKQHKKQAAAKLAAREDEHRATLEQTRLVAETEAKEAKKRIQDIHDAAKRVEEELMSQLRHAEEELAVHQQANAELIEKLNTVKSERHAYRTELEATLQSKHEEFDCMEATRKRLEADGVALRSQMADLKKEHQRELRHQMNEQRESMGVTHKKDRAQLVHEMNERHDAEKKRILDEARTAFIRGKDAWEKERHEGEERLRGQILQLREELKRSIEDSEEKDRHSRELLDTTKRAQHHEMETLLQHHEAQILELRTQHENDTEMRVASVTQSLERGRQLTMAELQKHIEELVGRLEESQDRVASTHEELQCARENMTQTLEEHRRILQERDMKALHTLEELEKRKDARIDELAHRIKEVEETLAVEVRERDKTISEKDRLLQGATKDLSEARLALDALRETLDTTKHTGMKQLEEMDRMWRERWEADRAALQRELDEEKRIAQEDMNHAQILTDERYNLLEQRLRELQHTHASRPARVEDLERIRRLEADLEALTAKYHQSQAEMKHYKMELINREEMYTRNFGRTFNVGVMEVGRPRHDAAPARARERDHKESKFPPLVAAQASNPEMRRGGGASGGGGGSGPGGRSRPGTGDRRIP